MGQRNLPPPNISISYACTQIPVLHTSNNLTTTASSRQNFNIPYIPEGWSLAALNKKKELPEPQINQVSNSHGGNPLPAYTVVFSQDRPSCLGWEYFVALRKCAEFLGNCLIFTAFSLACL